MMMMVVGGGGGWGGWVVCMELWPLAMQNATDMATLCCWARIGLTNRFVGTLARPPPGTLVFARLPQGTALGCALLSTSQ